MSQFSKMRHSRNQWKHKAKLRGERERNQRKQYARLEAKSNQTATALKATQAERDQLQAQLHGLVTRPKVEVIHLALQLFLDARLGFRAVSRVLSLLASPLGIRKAPCAQTVINWVIRLSMVRLESAQTWRGLPLPQAPFSNGLIWMIDSSIGLGQGKILAVLALHAPHHQLEPGAPALRHVRCLAVAVAASWTGDTIAALLKRLIAQMGRPAADLKERGSDLHKAAAVLAEQGRGSPCIDDISHAAAGMLTRPYPSHPAFETFLSICGRVSGKLKQTLLACLTPPNVRTKARFMNVHRLVTWADRVLQLSPPGGAKRGSIFAQLRTALGELPACKALITRFQGDAKGLLACQQILKTHGLSPATLAQCEPVIGAIPTVALRQEFIRYLHHPLGTATALGLDQVGLPISSDSIESLFGVGKHHGAGDTQDAARIALRLPACCGGPTLKEAQQVLDVTVAQQDEFMGQLPSLTKQRREVLSHPERLESLGAQIDASYIELIPSPKNRPKTTISINIPTGCENRSGPHLSTPPETLDIEKTGLHDIEKTAMSF